MDQRERALTLAAAFLLFGACGAFGGVLVVSEAWASSSIAAQPLRVPTPTPSGTPRPTTSPRPTPTPTHSPTPTPVPTPTPTPTPAPTVEPAPAPPPIAVANNGPPTGDGSAQAVAIAPTPRSAANAPDTGAPSETQSLVLLVTMVVLGIPTLIVMTLVATVLTRR